MLPVKQGLAEDSHLQFGLKIFKVRQNKVRNGTAGLVQVLVSLLQGFVVGQDRPLGSIRLSQQASAGGKLPQHSFSQTLLHSTMEVVVIDGVAVNRAMPANIAGMIDIQDVLIGCQIGRMVSMAVQKVVIHWQCDVPILSCIRRPVGMKSFSVPNVFCPWSRFDVTPHKMRGQQDATVRQD
jgi:hypothetical protein